MEKNLDIFNNIMSPYEEMLSYETLWAIEGMTEAKLSKLFKENDLSPSRLLEKISSKDLFGDERFSSLKSDVDKFLKTKLGSFSIVVNRDFQYPVGLRDALHPIEVFYYRGNLEVLTSRSVSIVGARKVSDEGKKRSFRLSKELSESGFTIVSGLASGVDTQAHIAAIKSMQCTIGVIGTPIDEYYPKENKSLQDEISKNHLLISQVPFYRYSKEPFIQHKHHFPRRNVTMASISEATIIVEASDTSGSLTQARACIHQNKKLFILDSCFKNKNISWPAYYLKKGAIRVKDTNDILESLGV